MRNTTFRLRDFACDRRGNVAILFGFALLPLMLAIGIAVDYGRALTVRERMSNAADASALAIGAWPGLTQAEAKTKAQQFFDANYPPSELGTVGKLDVAFNNEDITVTVKGSVDTTFLNVANVDHIDVGAIAKITKKERNIELALVLDTTGSMGSGGKLAALKTAAKKMVSDLFDGKTTSDTLMVSVVPFAAAVNVGSDKKNSGWIDTGTYPDNSAVAKEDVDFTNGTNAFSLYDQLTNRDWAGCVRERDGGAYELTDAPGGSSADSKWAPYFAPDEADSESNTTNNYMQDKNCSGTSSEYVKKQRCLVKYNNASASSSAVGPDYNCPPRPILALSDSKATVDGAIDALVAKGYTVIPAGLLWGWRVLSPTAPFTEGKSYTDEKWIKAIVLLTDGDNDVNAGVNNHNKSAYNAFGYAASGHLGATNGSTADTTLNTKTATVCDSVKAAGILVYTIGFQVSNSTIVNLLKNCATRPDMYYNSPSNDQLASIFQDIAQGLGELRIAQ